MFPKTTRLCDEKPAIGASSLSVKLETLNCGWSIRETREFLERAWDDAISQVSSPPVTEMMRYALAGGKCLRGSLLLAVTESCQGSKKHARDAAVSIEMLHAASLVVDDLPALDNACERRNAPSLHKHFGECAAILTAHALVSAAFEVITRIPEEPQRLVRIVGLLARAIGGRGMANAELVPVQFDPARSAVAGSRIRALKTGALFELSASIGALLAGAESELVADLAQLGLKLGVWYQVMDDLRDDVMSELQRESLLKESAQIRRDCDSRFQSVRGRLGRPSPLVEWIREFSMAGWEAGVA